jgi:hypothetical protein
MTLDLTRCVRACLQAARKQAAELQQLKQHLRQQLDEWALLAGDG